jgi:hypothetical protein
VKLEDSSKVEDTLESVMDLEWDDGLLVPLLWFCLDLF